jgi:translation initiation factor 1
MAKRPEEAAPQALGSLGEMLRARGVEVREPAPVAVPKGEADLSRSRKLVVRRERKGHGGKTVTVVEGVAASPRELEALARRLRKALGCGSWVDGGAILLQGDRAPAAEAWLRANGALHVVRGN